MEHKTERKWNLYVASFFVAAMAALMGFGAALTDRTAQVSPAVPEPQAAPEHTMPAYQSSAAQLSTVPVAPEDQGDRAVYMYY